MPSEVKPSPEARRRGRPRSEDRKQAILRAARELLEEGGPLAVTMEEVAVRAGVGKPTVYRWFPDRHAVTMAALMSEPGKERSASARRRSALAELRDQLEAIAHRFRTPTGRHIAALIAASDRDSELAKAFRGHFVLARRAEGRALLEQARAAGEIREDVDLDAALDLLYGAVFFRLMLGHAPLDESSVEGLFATALRGLGRARSSAQGGRKRAAKRQT